MFNICMNYFFFMHARIKLKKKQKFIYSVANKTLLSGY